MASFRASRPCEYANNGSSVMGSTSSEVTASKCSRTIAVIVVPWAAAYDLTRATSASGKLSVVFLIMSPLHAPHIYEKTACAVNAVPGETGRATCRERRGKYG